MDRFSIIRCSRATLIFPLLMMFGAAEVTAASITFTTRSICKVKSIFPDNGRGFGVMNAYCMVDIRQSNIKELMIARASGQDTGDTGFRLFQASASSRLVMTPGLFDDMDNGTGVSQSGLETELNMPFQMLTEAMRGFTGQEDLSLDAGHQLPLAGIPDLSRSSVSLFTSYTLLNQQGVELEPQMVIPLPPAAVLLGSGIIGLMGLGASVRRRPAG